MAEKSEDCRQIRILGVYNEIDMFVREHLGETQQSKARKSCGWY
jgi:hypothetical protein